MSILIKLQKDVVRKTLGSIIKVILPWTRTIGISPLICWCYYFSIHNWNDEFNQRSKHTYQQAIGQARLTGDRISPKKGYFWELLSYNKQKDKLNEDLFLPTTLPSNQYWIQFFSFWSLKHLQKLCHQNYPTKNR